MPSLIPTATETDAYTVGRAARRPLREQETLTGLLTRALLGQQTALPEIPVTVPTQQAISGLQDILQPILNRAFEAPQGLAARLSAPGGAPPTATPAAGAIPPGPGVPAFGRTQTRDELGLPARREAFPFTPTPEELEETIGLPPIRSTPRTRQRARQVRQLERRAGKIGERIERRELAGKGTGRAERKLGRVERKLRRRQL